MSTPARNVTRGKTTPSSTAGSFATHAHGAPSVALLDQPTSHADEDRNAVAVATASEAARRTGNPIALPADTVPGGVYFEDDGGMGGDASIGTEFSSRHTWATSNPERPFITVTTTFYAIVRLDGGDRDLDWQDHEDALAERQRWDNSAEAARTTAEFPNGEPPRLRYGIEEATEVIVHTDLEDLVSSDVGSEYEYGEGSAIFFDSLATAEQVSSRRAHALRPEHYNVTKWTN